MEDPRLAYRDNIMTYLIVGDEICPESGTQHWQCFVQTTKKVRMATVKSIFGNSVHCEPMRGTAEQASEYCKKEGNFSEFGTLVIKGERNDLLAAATAAATMTLAELMEDKD
jgi:hypothetical protein